MPQEVQVSDPQSESAPASPEAEAPESTSGAPDFSGLGAADADDLGSIDLGEASGSEPEPTPQPSASPEPEPSPAPATQQPEAPAEVKPQEPGADAQGQEQPQSPAPLGPAEVLEQLTQGRADFEKAVAESTFKLSEEEIAELDENPVVGTQKAMARAYVEAVSSTLHMISRHVPMMVQSALAKDKLYTSVDGAFRQRWPQINPADAKHGGAVKQFGEAFMKQNPKASMQDYIENVGAMVVTMLKLPAEAQPSGNGAGRPRAQQPIASEPFRPAVGGVPQAPGTQVVEPFAALGMDFDE